MFNAYLMAGLAMVFWGIAPIFGKLGLGEMQPLVALTIRSLVISVILLITMTVSGQWGNIAEVTAKDTTYIVLEGICAALLGQLAYYYALKFGEVGRVSPIVAAFPLVALLLGIVFLGEKVTFYKVVAAFLITSGIVLLKY
ncbi:EamA family transporter [Pelosinus baikalensis]|uniref:EamA family transporter n=1 Tax=Pelosinus baikalensis TaxID=2892015 RepID=A0ABS8HTJ1_9FIRM|nr:EamA family transporter [Pelosinus baikalensis]MCC5465422.1 EamA family transporter [Pelosinus baikalensis]